MKIYVRIFTKENNYTGTREIEIPEEELQELIESNYMKEGIILESFYIIGIKD